MGYTDLRDWIAQVEAMGELRRIHGADWKHEVIRSYPWCGAPGTKNLADLFSALRRMKLLFFWRRK
jgi:hypothetical protein